VDCPPSAACLGAERPRVLDLGAGGGGYAEHLNRTGLVAAQAFDATPSVERLTGGSVLQLDLAAGGPLPAPGAWALCLEVAEHVPAERAELLARTLGRLALRALVVSWARPEGCGLGWGHRNCLAPDDVVALFERCAQIRVDWPGTERLRDAASLPWTRQGVLLLRRFRPVTKCCAAASPPTGMDGGGRSMVAPSARVQLRAVFAGMAVPAFLPDGCA